MKSIIEATTTVNLEDLFQTTGTNLIDTTATIQAESQKQQSLIAVTLIYGIYYRQSASLYFLRRLFLGKLSVLPELEKFSQNSNCHPTENIILALQDLTYDLGSLSRSLEDHHHTCNKTP